MIRVYIAGSYSANNVIDVLRNIGRGQEIATEVFKRGYAPFCPWFDKEFVIGSWKKRFTVKKFCDYSMAWLEVSDCMLVVPNVPGMKDWQQSSGTLMEIEYAIAHNIPVFYKITDLDQRYK